ncbi:TrmH family RNA methyltransferase [Candidatus Protochlamydia phocaeensis]|uniref:TrmH family RNA methyltransferase n=1 Tax=Candidatus Protochlamydia phocaeensis TaxID=1414722 RepID=UPI000838F045|nr:TrmH family RNA methyltransferase [Candidatus Protochlamydia phocaeensis]
MYDFTKRKFLALSSESQHKKCAELLRRLYEKGCGADLEEWAVYKELLHWTGQPALPSFSPQAIADRYHWHNKCAGISKKEHHLLPSIRTGDRSHSPEPWPIAVYLDRLRSAHNVGSILRTVEALGLGTVYFSPDTPFVDHKQVQDASMGAYQWVSCQRDADLSMPQRPLIALETSEEAIALYDFIFPSSFTLIVGNEEYGCSEESLRQADYLVEIPLRGRKNSLNVANAFAMAGGEIQRQRRLTVAEENK